MRNLFIFTLLVLFCFNAYSQVNTNPEMVLNGGFEEYYACPDDLHQLEKAKHWINPTPEATPDFLHRCGNSANAFVVRNALQNPTYESDTAYVYRQIFSGKGTGAFLFYHVYTIQPEIEFREYEEVELVSLEAGKTYEVEFYVKLINALGFAHACNNIGAYFSVSMIKQEGFYGVLNYTPHINYTSIVSDTANYTKISGEYIATGGEQYLTIGNFFPNHLTDTLKIRHDMDTIPVAAWYRNAYYLLDNVSVKEKMGSSITNDEIQENIRVYPNPVNEYINISGLIERTMYTLTNNLGRVVQTGILYPNSTQILSLKNLPEGIYILNLNQNQKNTNHKILIVH